MLQSLYPRKQFLPCLFFLVLFVLLYNLVRLITHLVFELVGVFDQFLLLQVLGAYSLVPPCHVLLLILSFGYVPVEIVQSIMACLNLLHFNLLCPDEIVVLIFNIFLADCILVDDPPAIDIVDEGAAEAAHHSDQMPAGYAGLVDEPAVTSPALVLQAVPHSVDVGVVGEGVLGSLYHLVAKAVLALGDDMGPVDGDIVYEKELLQQFLLQTRCQVPQLLCFVLESELSDVRHWHYFIAFLGPAVEHFMHPESIVNQKPDALGLLEKAVHNLVQH